jgi:hypothetical protein
LSDGNILVISPAQSGSALGFSIAILSPDRQRVLSQIVHSPAYSGVNPANNYNVYIGLFFTSATQFRVFFLTPDNSEQSQQRAVCYQAYTYNAGTFAVAVSGSVVLVNNFAATVSNRYNNHKQGARFVPIRAGTQDTALDMSTSTFVNFTGLTSALGTVEWTDPDEVSAGNEFGIVRYSAGTRKVVKFGVAASTDLPANVAALFVYANKVKLIAVCTYLILNPSTGAFSIVKFDSNYATAVFWTVAASSLVSGYFSSATNLSVVSDGLRYWVYSNNLSPIFSFCWDGTSQPYGQTFDTLVKIQDRPAFSRREKPCLMPQDVLIAAGWSVLSGSTFRSVFYSFNAQDFMPHASVPFGLCLNSAAQGQPIELNLIEGSKTEPNLGSFNTIGYRYHQGVLTQLKFVENHFKFETVNIASNQSATTGNMYTGYLQGLIQANLQIGSTSLGGNSVFTTSGKSKVLVTSTAGIDGENSVVIANPVLGIIRWTLSSSGVSGHGGYSVFQIEKPTLLAFTNNFTNMKEEGL